jgi:hypothetical protein
MKTKTLLIAAAALAAGVMSSQAQVYSQNIVGYVNIPLTNGQLQILAPALDLDGTGTNNTVSTVFPTNGTTVGDVVFVFNGSGYDTLNYITSGHGASAVTGWFLGSTLTNTYPINPGQGVFYSPAANETNTQVGVVLQGSNVVNRYFPSAGNVSIVASVSPVAGGLTSALGYTPTVGDVVFQFNGAGYNTYNYITSGHGASAVTGWFLGSTETEPQIPIGTGFWIQPEANTNWTENFNFSN